MKRKPPHKTAARLTATQASSTAPGARGTANSLRIMGNRIGQFAMPFGAGLVAARNAGASTIVDPRPYAVGSIRAMFESWPQLTNVLPAMGYSDGQLLELATTINRADCDVVVTGTPIDLGRLIRSRHPIRHVHYELEEVGTPTIADILDPIVGRSTPTRSELAIAR